MSNTDKIRLEYDTEDSFVDLSKPFDTDKLYYEVIADSDVKPDKENTLYLPIKGVYFNAIMSGEKTEEYREVKLTTYKKYLLVEGEDIFYLREDFPDTDFNLNYYYNGFYPFLPKPYKYLKLAVGYEKERDWAIVEVVGISFEPATDENGNIIRFDYNEEKDEYELTPDGGMTDWIIVYHLGKVIEFHPKSGVQTGEQAFLPVQNKQTGMSAHPKVEEPAVKYEKQPHILDGTERTDKNVCSPKRNFDYLKDNPDFADLYTLCNEAEVCQWYDPEKSALSSRRALEYITKAIYLLKGFRIPERASLFELVDSQEFKDFINDETLMKNLHYIRKAGNNAAHLGNVTRTESFYSLLNLHNFVGSVLMMLDVIEMFPRFDKTLLTREKELYVTPKTDIEPTATVIKKYEKVAEKTAVLNVTPLPEYFTEAETRALYIDQLLREAGWKIATEKNVFAPNIVGVEIEVKMGEQTGMSVHQAQAGMSVHPKKGYVDYVIYGNDGKP